MLLTTHKNVLQVVGLSGNGGFRQQQRVPEEEEPRTGDRYLLEKKERRLQPLRKQETDQRSRLVRCDFFFVRNVHAFCRKKNGILFKLGTKIFVSIK